MKKDNHSFRELNELGLLVSDQVTAMLAYWDKDLISRFANNAYHEWFGRTREEMMNKMHISELLGPLYEKNLPYIKAALAGEKQVFEREIPIPNGSGTRHSLATYIPDVRDGEVIGFFVHVADVTHVKKLEQQLTQSKREILRNIIDTEESESRRLVYILRENINQRLAACKMLTDEKKENLTESDKVVNKMMADIIDEINSICEELTPSELEIFGIIKTIEIACEKFSLHYPVTIEFNCFENAIEQIDLDEKLTIFRIVQNFIRMSINNLQESTIKIILSYDHPEVSIRLLSTKPLLLSPNTKEYKAIECRVEYNGGSVIELRNEEYSGLLIRFQLNKS
ncbi:PAS domain-containing protein [Lacibacter sediminis]|uniref:PAS domain-containing protein n=1 Tax=Lacibacter sediminis TaxID=2760713 RepID=A0A7G5XH08_9BACT|nr:PAS domain-containing protein [Lacibacter sediminis]QNA44761.1 PAS domain-containing protein [Lacibacter sediminis]